MSGHNYRDMVGGALLAGFGLFAAEYARRNYDVGTMSQMGTGMFPMLFGYLLAGLGALSIAPALFTPGDLKVVNARAALTVLLSVAAFGLLIDRLGLLPAVVACIATASLAEGTISLPALVGLCLVMSLATYAVFRLALGLPLPLIGGIG